MKDDDIERAIGKLQRVAIHHTGIYSKAKARGAATEFIQHGGREVGGGEDRAGADEIEVEAGARADDEDTLAGLEVGEGHRTAAHRVDGQRDEVIDWRPTTVAEAIPRIGVEAHGRGAGSWALRPWTRS